MAPGAPHRAVNPGAPGLFLLAAAMLASTCLGATPSAAPAPGVRASPTEAARPSEPTPTPLRAPAAYLLTNAQAGLPRRSQRDHLGYLQAASEELNQATALELYQTFDWVDEAQASYGSSPRTLTEKVLVTLRVAGARNAFAYWGGLAVTAPLLARPCPTGTGLDQCAEGRSGAQGMAAGRRGLIVFQLSTENGDLDALLLAAAANLNAP